MKVDVYGIKNCSTVKKALVWLENKKIDYTFHDYKKEPVTLEKLNDWQTKVSWEIIINKRGTTWRKLAPETQKEVIDAASANKLLLMNNSIIKRPVISYNNKIIVGFDEKSYEKAFFQKDDTHEL